MTRAMPVLRRVDDRSIPDRPYEVRAFLCVRDEVTRLPSALAHHRHLLVDRFLVVDNGSTDGTLEYLLNQPDVHIFTSEASYQDARNGIDWLEMLLHVYGAEHWCLLLDADELLVVPDSVPGGLPAFCGLLEGRGLNCLATMFLDLYAEGRIVDTQVEGNRDPLDVCRYFDASGYFHFPAVATQTPRLYGGPRARLFWPELDLDRYSRSADSYVALAFDEQKYLQANGDVAAAVRSGEVNSGLVHFVRYGRDEGRTAPIRDLHDWPEEAYLRANPDVAESIAQTTFRSGIEHFVQHGQFEGRLLWTDGPPCMTQVPLVYWNRHMRVAIGRHNVIGGTWRHHDRVGGVLLHIKLTADLVKRGASTQHSDRAEAWTLENARYRKRLEENPQLSAFGATSQQYRDCDQLVTLGLIAPTEAL